MHGKSFIHRDIKPDNFLIGPDKTSNTIYLIDYGLSKRYEDRKTRKHIPYKDNKSLTGTLRYASLNTHLGMETSRRDDLEAVGFVLIYFLRGKLPWQGTGIKNSAEKMQAVLERKLSVSVETLCKDLPCISYLLDIM